MESRGWLLVKKALEEPAEGKKRVAEEDLLTLENKKSKAREQSVNGGSSGSNRFDAVLTLEVNNKEHYSINTRDETVIIDHLINTKIQNVPSSDGLHSSNNVGNTLEGLNEDYESSVNKNQESKHEGNIALPGCSFWNDENIKTLNSNIKESMDKSNGESVNNLECSMWESVKVSDDPSAMRVRLCKVKNKKEEINIFNSFSEDEESVDDTDADSDFECSSTESEDEYLTEKDNRKKKKQDAVRRHKTNKNNKNMEKLDHQPPNLLGTEIENSEIEGKKGRKPKADPNKWIRNLKKSCRNKGLKYLSNTKTPKEIKQKSIQLPCDMTCKLKCITKINNVSREVIFKNFWELGDVQLQREFISKMMSEVNPTYRYPKENSKRKCNNAFYFFVNENKIRVCKRFFKATLNINDRVIRTVIDKCKDGFIEFDKRGKHGNQKQVDPEIKKGVHDFIKSIPKIVSHYLRAQTSKEFIDGGKSIASLFRDYKAECVAHNVPHVNETMFIRIFNSYNLSFYVPKKDQCDLCVAYQIADPEEKERLKESYSIHIKNKDLARQEKQKDKALEVENNNLAVAVFDLQAVLPSPRGEVSQFYYKSKINSYNLTISDLKAKHVECFFWHEGEGKRCAVEIASCVFKYLQKISQNKNNEELEIILYSDNCCGQQKNTIVFSMYLYAVQVLKIKSLTHKFLVRGHTQNEGDNVHSVIEKMVKRTLKSGPIYTPQEYITIIKNSKVTGTPYKVNVMSHSDFIDWKDVSKHIGSNFTRVQKEGEDETEMLNNTSTDILEKEQKHGYVGSNEIKIGDIKVIQVKKSYPRMLFVKTSYENELFLRIAVNEGKKIKKRGVKNKNPIEFEKIKCLPAYENKLPIGERKVKDIQDLINAKLIPEFYRHYYNGILN